MAHQGTEGLLDPQVQRVYKRSVPDVTQVSDEPLNIYERVYVDPLNEDEEVDMYSFNDAPESEETTDGGDLYDFEVDTNDPLAENQDLYNLDETEDLYLAPEGGFEELEVDPNAEWKPEKFLDYAQRELTADKEIDWGGAEENSLVRHTYEWIKESLDPDYVNPLSIQGRMLAIRDIAQQLHDMGPVRLSDSKKVRQAKLLWDKRHELQLKNMLDAELEDAELPDMETLIQSIRENPESFFKGMVQEIVNKPELLLVPQVAAARGAMIGSRVAQSISASAKTAKVLKTSGLLGGAYTGGMTLGTIDRAIEDRSRDNDIDWLKAMEQAQVDAVLGTVLVGTGAVVTKAISRTKQPKIELPDNLRDVDNVDIEATIRDPMTETFIDEGGNVYTLEVRETVDSIQMKQDIDVMRNELTKYADDPEISKALEFEMAATQRELNQENLDSGEIKGLQSKLKSLAEQKDNLRTREELESIILRGSKRFQDETNNFVSVTDINGNRATLRRLTRDVLNSGLPLKVESLADAVKTPKGPVAAMNKYQAAMADFFVSATSSIDRLREASPTAQVLLDLVDPRTKAGKRTFTETIQEATHHKQGEWSVRSQDISKTLNDSQKISLANHMRGVEVSEDPVVVQAAAGYRALLDEALDYARQSGQKIQKVDNFLPRYYNQQSLKTPEARAAMADRILEATNKYTREEIESSAFNISRNIVRDSSDEAAYIERGGKINPIGSRSWEEVPDSAIAEFLDPEFIGSIERFLMNTAQRTELDKVFGPNGSKIDDLLAQVAKEVQTSSAGERFLLETEKQAFKDVYDLLAGSYGSNGGRAYKSGTDAVMAAQAVTKLPLVTVTSALEPTTLLFRLEEGGKLGALVQSFTPMKLRKLWSDRTPEQIQREAMEVGLIHDAALKERLDAMVGEGMSGLPAKVTTKAMKGFGLHQWTEHTRTIAYELGRNDIIRMAKGLALQPMGRKSKTRTRRLEALGLRPKEVAKWVADGADVNSPYYASVKKAAARLANEVIANPNKINKGKWMSSNTPLARMTSQFKSFSSTFFNTVATPILREIRDKWNEGNKIGAMRDTTSLFAVMSGMAYWAGYKNDTLYSLGSDEELKIDEKEFAKKMASGALSYLTPGGYLIGPGVTGQSTVPSMALGSAFGDLEKVRRSVAEGDPSKLLGIVPLADKGLKELTENSGPNF